MKQIKLIKYGSIVLLLGNIALICYIFFGRPPHPDHKPPKEVIIEKLGFDAKQIADYDGAIQNHQRQIRSEQNKLKRLKKIILADLKHESSCVVNDSLLMQFTAVQQKIERIHFAHFCEIKSICKGDQVQKFKSLVDELDRLFAPKPLHPGKRP